MLIKLQLRSLLMVGCAAMLTAAIPGCDDTGSGRESAATAPSAKLILDAANVPADFLTHQHTSEDLSIRAPADWQYLQQSFNRQNDVLIGLFPPGSIPALGGPTRLYIHGHVLPNQVTFDQYVHGHESGSFAKSEGQSFLSSEAASLNGLPAHKWISAGQPTDGIKTKRLMIAVIKGQTVYYSEFRASPEKFDEYAPVVEQIIASLIVGQPKHWSSPPPPPMPRN